MLSSKKTAPAGSAKSIRQTRRKKRKWQRRRDVEWSETDPLGREVTMLKSIVRLREGQGKHPDPPEFISTSEVRAVVSDPDRIDESATHKFREVYYRNESDEEYPYSRAVVDFRDSPQRGIVVSWSRYETPVSSYGVKWRRG